jgi:hypothetical protein
MTPADPMSVVLNVIAMLRHQNSFDADTLLRLAESIATIETLIGNARDLSTHEQHALRKALGTVRRSVDWDNVTATLSNWAVEKKKEKNVRCAISKQVDPLWSLRIYKKV